jgi:dTDP-4-dehydrorhamnose 3,5-epimerase
MKVEETHLKGLFVITPDIIEDNRGFFAEFFRKDVFASSGAGELSFVQQNLSFSKKGVVRGLHFQWEPKLGKLVRATDGRVMAVGVDIRKQSPTLGKWFSVELSKENKKSMWLPPGFAYGFCVLSDVAEVQYLYTALYNAKGESGVRWNDPDIGVEWPVTDPILSEKDAIAQSFKEWLARPESDNF